MVRRGAWAAAAALAWTASSPAQAFVFDVWRSGSKVEKVVEAGREKGASVEFEGGGVPFFGKKEPEELAEKVEYRCDTKLMGYDAKILFSFTPESRVLHTVRVALSLPMSSEKADVEVLADAIAKQLDAKYKDLGDTSAESLLGQLADKVRDVRRSSWKGGGDTVTMEATSTMLGGEVVVVYVDDKLAERAAVEDRRIREKKLDRTSGGDRSKF